LQNGLQLNLDKSEALIVGTTNELRAVTSSVSSLSVAGVDLPVADDIKVLGDRVRSASVVSQARLDGGAIVQLPLLWAVCLAGSVPSIYTFHFIRSLYAAASMRQTELLSAAMGRQKFCLSRGG